MAFVITDPTLPSYTRPELVASAADLTLVHDLLAGTRQMHEQSQARGYIRKWKDEDQSVYDIRRKIETVFEGLGRTISSATGMLFAKPPGVTWNASEAAMTELWANLDAAGTAGPVFVKRFSEAALRDGLGIILVDHTPTPIDPETKLPVVVHGGNEKTLGLRPTWAMYGRSQVINWKTAVINGKKTLTLMVFYECSDVDVGAFGIEKVHRFRELRLINGAAVWRLWELVGDDGSKLEHFRLVGAPGVFMNKLGDVADFLPVAVAYTGRTDAPMTATIPLMGVAWANLSHWRQSTNLTFYREVAAFPQPKLTGTLAQTVVGETVVPGTLRIGPMVAVHLSEPTATFEWAELQGSSMDQLEKGIQEKLSQMSKLGVAFLQTDTRAAETAAAKRLDATAENSTLATAAQGIEDAGNHALEITAWYLGIEKAGAPVLTISRDYESTAMDPQTMVAYVTAVKEAGLPIRILLEAWLAGGRLPSDTDLDALEADMEAAAAAKDEQQRQQAADALALKLAGGQKVVA